jgi:magnesium transporter
MDNEENTSSLEDEMDYLAMSESLTTEEIDDYIDQRLEDAFEQPTGQVVLHDVARLASDFDPIDLARAVTRLPPKARWIVYDNLPDLPAKIIFMIHTGSKTRGAIFRQTPDKEIIKLIGSMPPDEAVVMIEDLSDRRLKRILDKLDPKRAQKIKELQAHGRDTAGRLMSNEFFAFGINATVGEVAKAIRNNPGIELTSRIFVINEDKELIGAVPDRNLIISPKDLPIRSVMVPVHHTVHPETPSDDVVDLVDRYSIPALPVLDDKERLVGVIAYEDAVDAMRDIADETIANIAGTAEDVSEEEPIINRILLRCPFLVVTLFAGITTSIIMTHFRDRYWFAFVPFFVPLTNMLSGNVGLQCSTILVRWMATGNLDSVSKRDAMIGEIIVGTSIGALFGLSCGALIFLLNNFGIYHISTDPWMISFMVSGGLFVACVTATVLGTFSPILFNRVNIDPAVASGPIVTAFNDLLSTTMFIIVAFAIHTFFV